MSWRCVVYGCDNVTNTDEGVSIHISPAKKSESDKWKRFVRLHRANFQPKGQFGVCSKHFSQDCFSRAVHIKRHQRRLKKGAIPSIWWHEESPEIIVETVSDRSRRKVSVRLYTVNKYYMYGSWL